MELAGRNLYEHADMPWEFQLESAWHAADEARHSLIIERAANRLGVSYGDYPVYLSSYEGQYQFGPCEPGSKRELLWRILLRQTFHEGLALDSLAFEVRKRGHAQQFDLASLFEWLLVDEIFHAQSGLRWSRFLCEGNEELVLNERGLAHEYFVAMVKEARARFVIEHPEEAMAEVDQLDSISRREQLPFHRVLNITARKAAGFTDADLEQIVGWGYVPRA